MFNQNKERKERVVQGLTLVGISAIIALFMWGAVQAIRLGPSLASGVFNNVSTNITAAVVQLNSLFIPNKDTNENSGEPFTESSDTESGGLFVVAPKSIEEIEEIEDQQGSGLSAIPEGPEGQNVTSGGGSGGGDSIPPTSSPDPVQGEKSEQLIQFLGGEDAEENPNGEIDLAIRITETGILDKDTNEFTVTDSMGVSNRGAVQFEVINLGTKTSDEWVFSAVLPTNPAYTFNSDKQSRLAPGDRIEFTLGFDSVIHESEGTITIHVDPDGNMQEVTKDNNSVNEIIQIDLISN